ncbi:sugar phosphate nucleotidyltransferase [Kitasatospora sp. GP82]|uniref:sugar phosphate nucleotidyltransferase n=1 Tax=Kitasatospora sp. GP82 TaxID=3035089 RepID=UPI002475E52D|nr:sugar phosphate nucleotidyltransferase [Kitasatospora sp. GP82]MDH6130258.1 UTP--glucose-1-phosphate uridylyltransferase [Kitasatospora sp. GP82]
MPALKAVIAAAGVGSRWFPVGKTTPKCMLPAWNKPLLAYTVADCVAAGARQIAVITAPGECTRQVRHFLTEDPELKSYFTARGWQDKYQPIDQPPAAEFTIIEQPRDNGLYGTALPPICAADWIGEDDFLLVSGDDLLLRLDLGSDLADLAAARRTAQSAGAIAVASRPSDRPIRYGIVHPRPCTGPHQLLDEVRGWLPADRQRRTAHIDISRTLLPASALPYFTAVELAANGELRATDAITAFARHNDMLIHPILGTFYDCGSPEGLHAANTVISGSWMA